MGAIPDRSQTESMRKRVVRLVEIAQLSDT